MAMIENDTLQIALWLVVAIGALNWGLVEFLDFNLITDLLQLSKGSTEYQAAIGVVGAAGALNIYELVMEEL